VSKLVLIDAQRKNNRGRCQMRIVRITITPMILCLCHRVTDHAIADAVRAGCRSFDALQDATCVASGCGACEDDARQAFAQAQRACTATSQTQPRVVMLHAVG
jgi:bacterioferritin-associated ferredoxin